MIWWQPAARALAELAPLLLCFVARRRDARAWASFLGFAGLFALNAWAVGAGSRVSIFDGESWNWWGKLFSLAWGVGFVLLNPWLSRDELGWRRAPVAGSRRLVLGLVAIPLALRWFLSRVGRDGASRFDPETFWYQATMPGLAEEVTYRGIFLALLRRAFPGRLVILGVAFSHGLLLSALLFGLAHGMSWGGAAGLQFNMQKLVMTGAMGMLFGFIVERGGSLVPAIVLHNLYNLIVTQA